MDSLNYNTSSTSVLIELIENRSAIDESEPSVLVSRKISSVGWFIYCFPIVFLIGLAGNILAVVVLRRKAMKTSCSSIYLLFLALADTTVLCLSGFKTWLRLVTGFELMHTSDCSCRLIMYGFYSATHISAWVIVLVTVERLLMVHWPLKAGHTWLVRRPILTVSILTFVIMIINTNILYTAELAYYVKHPSLLKSSTTGKYEPFYNANNSLENINVTVKTLVCSAKRNTLITNINLFIYCLLPSVLLFSFNVAIIRTTKIVTSLFSTRINTIHDRLCSSEFDLCAKHKIDAAGCHNPCLDESPKTKNIENISRKSIPLKIVSSSRQNFVNPDKSCGFRKNITVIRQRAMKRQTKECSQQRLTLTLLTLSFCWLIFSFPYSLIDSELRLFRVEANIRLICFFMMYINHAINFYLYCFLRQKFRNELKRCFENCSKIKVSGFLRTICLALTRTRKTPSIRCHENLERNPSLGIELVILDTKKPSHVTRVVGGTEKQIDERKNDFNDFRLISCPSEHLIELIDENKSNVTCKDNCRNEK